MGGSEGEGEGGGWCTSFFGAGSSVSGSVTTSSIVAFDVANE